MGSNGSKLQWHVAQNDGCSMRDLRIVIVYITSQVLVSDPQERTLLHAFSSILWSDPPSTWWPAPAILPHDHGPSGNQKVVGFLQYSACSALSLSSEQPAARFLLASVQPYLSESDAHFVFIANGAASCSILVHALLEHSKLLDRTGSCFFLEGRRGSCASPLRRLTLAEDEKGALYRRLEVAGDFPFLLFSYCFQDDVEDETGEGSPVRAPLSSAGFSFVEEAYPWNNQNPDMLLEPHIRESIEKDVRNEVNRLCVQIPSMPASVGSIVAIDRWKALIREYGFPKSFFEARQLMQRELLNSCQCPTSS